MVNRLNGWQRIGVILTVLWAGFILLAAASDYYEAPTRDSEFVESVMLSPDPRGLDRVDFVGKDGTHTSHTWNEVSGQTAMLNEPRLKLRSLLLWLLGPILAGWLLAYTTLHTVRWVVAGFKARA